MKYRLKNFKKSEIAIYAIAIMLVAAGYLNYTSVNNKNLIETSAPEATNIAKENTSIGDATLVNSDDILEENVTSEILSNQGDYFVDSKLSRDTNYATMISNYTAILERDNVSETEKKIAMQEITNINNTKNAIMICENILSTKGFENNIIFINNKSINVVVQVDGGLTQEKVAQIQNVICRELDAKIENIHITEK